MLVTRGVYKMSSQVPIVLLKEGSNETKYKDAQRNNITTAKLVTEMIKSSLGLRGMEKMLVNQLGDVIITNDGATILKEMDVQYLAVKEQVINTATETSSMILRIDDVITASKSKSPPSGYGNECIDRKWIEEYDKSNNKLIFFYNNYE